MDYTVSQLAKLAGVSVRTLHHYDEIGLLEPSYLKANGYRYYARPELLRLQQILFFRELGFPLAKIALVIDSPEFDVARSLRDQKKLLELQRERLDALLATIEKTIKDIEGETRMKAEDLYSGFTKEQVAEYRQEVIDRWGEDSLNDSEARIAAWTPGDGKWVEAEAGEVLGRMVERMEAGAPPDDPEVQELTGRYFEYIRRFFDCTVEVFRELGKMYVEDPRFAAYYARYHDGLAAYMRDSMAAWCDAREKEEGR
jgi:DNA-binding transcriptional MerR regulator